MALTCLLWILIMTDLLQLCLLLTKLFELLYWPLAYNIFFPQFQKDTEALSLLDAQMKILQTIHSPASLEENSGHVLSIVDILHKVKKCIEIIADYVCEITAKLEDIRDMVKEYDVEIAENLEEMTMKYLLTGK